MTIAVPHIRLCAMAAAATYEATAIPAFQDDMRTVHVFRSIINDIPAYSWEGTTDFWEWVLDFLAFRDPFTHKDYGPVHFGLMRDVMAVKAMILADLNSIGNPQYLFIGHSKGGGEVLLAHAEMKSIGYPPLATRAFEPPRVGTKALWDYLAGEDIQWTATHNRHGTDLVTLVPDDIVPMPLLSPWVEGANRMEIVVSDALDIPNKHRMTAVLSGLPAIPLA